MLGKLYIVATPIGNLEDVTLRAVNVISDVDIILAEDTRITKKLLDFINSLGIKKLRRKQKLVSYHQHSDEVKKLEVLSYLVKGFDIVLVTDAGTPGISDPGNELIDYLLSYQPDLQIIPIPGPSAVTAALSVSGFDTSKFLFLGFWPKKKVSKLIQLIKLSRVNIVFYESPYRIVKTLMLFEKEFGGDTKVFVARELTKIHETLYRGKIRDVKESLANEVRVKGELVVVFELR
jgi:16S rRNA (cytidine1402-2'-O)-methyltransferase